MESHFIKGFDKRYSIMADGNVVCHYRYNRSNKKLYYNPPRILTKNNTNGSINVTFLNAKTKKRSSHSVFKLMCIYFNISKPDNLHRWVSDYLDGNHRNHEISNLGFKLFNGCNHKYKVEIFENKTKTCNKCGKIKKYEEFGRTGKGTLKFSCKSCMYHYGLPYVRKYRKDNPEKIKKIVREYRCKNPDRHKEYSRTVRLKLSDNYVRSQLYMELSRSGANDPHITQEMIDIKRIMIQCSRLIAQQQ